MSCEISISINNVSKKFDIYDRPVDRLKQLLFKKKYYKEFWALSNISLDIYKGETFALIGRNGSGKSTLLQTVVGTLLPSSGSISTKGRLAALLELGSGFNPELTGRENVYINGLLLGLSKKEIADKFDKIASFADIGFHLDQPVKTYSSGMYVRLAFAVQACIEPDVLIVDEALAVGDEKFQRKCFSYIESLRENGSTILVVSHSISTIEKFCQRAALLDHGKLVSVGRAKEVIDDYHAMLYSDMESYISSLNQCSDVNQKTTLTNQNLTKEIHDEKRATCSSKSDFSLTPHFHKKAEICNPSIKNKLNQATEVFRIKDSIRFEFDIRVNEDIKNIQIGLLIRTIEGITAVGTSSAYFGENIKNSKKGNYFHISISTETYLSEGSYFVTLALAEISENGEQTYLDRLPDVFLMKIMDKKTTCSGIAFLPFNFSIEQQK